MTRIILVRSGSTEFDQDGRIKGTLDIPLSREGSGEALRLADELSNQEIEYLYCAPCQSAEQTAELLAKQLHLKHKTLRNLQNLDHGLWQGKRIEELKIKQSKVYRQWQEQPGTVCPPEGEMLSSAQGRVKTCLDKLIKKHKHRVVALVVPEPLTSIVRCYLEQSVIGDLWKTTCAGGSWESIDVEPKQLATMAANQT